MLTCNAPRHVTTACITTRNWYRKCPGTPWAAVPSFIPFREDIGRILSDITP